MKGMVSEKVMKVKKRGGPWSRFIFFKYEGNGFSKSLKRGIVLGVAVLPSRVPLYSEEEAVLIPLCAFS